MSLPDFSAYLLTMGKLAFESMDFVGSTLHMLAFASAESFFIISYTGQALFSSFSLWGLITVLPCLAGTLLAVFGVQVPFFIICLMLHLSWLLPLDLVQRHTGRFGIKNPSRTGNNLV